MNWETRLFPMQIYTNFESNSQPNDKIQVKQPDCFRCKFTQILKAIHNFVAVYLPLFYIVSDANLHKFWKQFTTSQRSHLLWILLFPMQIYTNFESNSQHKRYDMPCQSYCFRCKFTQILKAIHNTAWAVCIVWRIVSDANLHKFWKQFTTRIWQFYYDQSLFPMQIYTNFESNSQQEIIWSSPYWYCFRCKFTQILKAIHNNELVKKTAQTIVSDANLHKFWKQFTTWRIDRWCLAWLFPMQIYTNFESNSQL